MDESLIVLSCSWTMHLKHKGLHAPMCCVRSTKRTNPKPLTYFSGCGGSKENLDPVLITAHGPYPIQPHERTHSRVERAQLKFQLWYRRTCRTTMTIAKPWFIGWDVDDADLFSRRLLNHWIRSSIRVFLLDTAHYITSN